MTRIYRLPYLTPLSQRLEVKEWVVLSGKDESPLGELLPWWDAAVLIQAATSVWVDTAGVLADCGLESDARLRLAAIWHSPGTMLRGCGDSIDLDLRSPSQETVLYVQVEGVNLANSIELSVDLLLTQPGRSSQQPFTPRLVGSVLYQSAPHKVLLEGQGPRFPVEVIDFSETYYAADAGWVLYWDPDNLHQTVLGDVRLYINSRHERVKLAVSENRPEDFDIREAIRFDVARTLIYGALNNEEFISEPELFAQGSIGAAVRSMLRLYFPQLSFVDLRENSRQPQLFNHKLQSTLRVFWAAM